MSDKKIPQRMCIVCKEMFDKNSLVRIVKNDNGIEIDTTGKKNGRGAYICKNGCILKCEKSHALERNFKTPISKEIYEKIITEFNNFAG